jgi:hypothetical protein
MSLMLDREYAPEAENAHKESFGRTAVRVLLLSVVITALVAGLYMAFGGNDKTDPLAAGTTTGQPAAAGAKTGAQAAPAPLTYEQKVAAAAAKLPKSTAEAGVKRAALVKYLTGPVGIKLSADSSPATASTTACGFLAKGTSPSTMINQVAAGGGYTKAQSKAFLLGASTLYCPSYAKNFK